MICGVESQRLGKPVVLDPVGIGASAWRLRWADELLAAFHPEILRVNFGEARALAHGVAEESGVDSLAQASTMARLALARRLARQAGSVVLLSGPEDIVTNGLDAFCIRGGSARTAQVTGAGCMLSVLCGAFAAVEPNPLQAAALAAAFWKVCSQRAERAAQGRGTFTFPPVPSGAGVVFLWADSITHPKPKQKQQPAEYRLAAASKCAYFFSTGVTCPSSSTVAATIWLRVLRAISSSRIRLGKSDSNVYATPCFFARPVRPMRWI